MTNGNDNVSVVARDGAVAHRFRVARAIDVAAGPDSADFLVRGASGSRLERHALDGRSIQSRALKLRLDALGPEVDGERIGLIRRAAGASALRLDGRVIARFAPDVVRVGVCRLGSATYLVAASSGGTSLIDAAGGKALGVAVPGVDATCIDTLSGTMLGVVQRRGDVSDLALVALPALQQIAALSLGTGATRIAAGDGIAYVLVAGTDPSARPFAREALDFREELIRNVHFK